MTTRDDLVAAMRAAANRAFPKVEPYTDREHMRRLAQMDAAIFHATSQPVAWHDLTDEQLAALTAVLDRVAARELDAHLRANGTYEIRRAPNTKRRVA